MTSAINAILTLGQAIASAADREANALVATSTAHLIFSGSILLASIALLAAGLVAEHLCTVPPDSDEDRDGPAPAR